MVLHESGVPCCLGIIMWVMCKRFLANEPANMPQVSIFFAVFDLANCRKISIVFCGMTTMRKEPANKESERSYCGFCERSNEGFVGILKKFKIQEIDIKFVFHT